MIRVGVDVKKICSLVKEVVTIDPSAGVQLSPPAERLRKALYDLAEQLEKDPTAVVVDVECLLVSKSLRKSFQALAEEDILEGTEPGPEPSALVEDMSFRAAFPQSGR